MSTNAKVPNPNLLYDLEKGLAESRKTTPKLLTQAEMQEKGVEFMARLGIKCVKPAYPIPLDGDCLWSCFAMSRNPYLTKEELKAEAFHFRLRGVGLALERIRSMGDEQLAMVQSVIAEKDREPQTREEIIEELTKYMQSGVWSGDMGDIMASVAASGLCQGLIIIHPGEHPYCTYAAPDCGMFRGNEDLPYPCIAIQQGNHYETALVHKDSKESARNLYQRMKEGEGVTVQAGVRVSKGRNQTSTPLQSDPDKEQQPPNATEKLGLSSKDVARNSQRVEEVHQCNCGYKGSIASHLRSSHQCVQGIREELSLGAEMSNEVLIIQATLVLGGCPAAGCPGGSHTEMPDLCLSWWKEDGWNFMQWQGPPSNLNSAAIRERVNKFVEELTQGYEEQKQNKDEINDDCKRDIQNSGNLKERSMEDPDNIVEPPKASTPVQSRNERQEGRNKPAVNVSKH